MKVATIAINRITFTHSKVWSLWKLLNISRRRCEFNANDETTNSSYLRIKYIFLWNGISMIWELNNYPMKDNGL